MFVTSLNKGSNTISLVDDFIIQSDLVNTLKYQKSNCLDRFSICLLPNFHPQFLRTFMLNKGILTYSHVEIIILPGNVVTISSEILRLLHNWRDKTK